MRADLHVHSIHSEPRHYRRAGLRDCYASAAGVYAAARSAGMDLVTITDRDTIEGCLRLLDERGDLSDFIIGEEVEAGLPGSDLKVHVNVWGITESQHREIQRLRASVEELMAYLRAEKVASCFNHFVGTLPVDLPSAAIYRKVLGLFEALEVRNGSQGRQYNALVASLAVGEAAHRSPVAFIGGSDAHTLRRVGMTWTEAAASSREEFLREIRAGRTTVGGRVGRTSDLVKDLGSLTLSHYAFLWDSIRGRGDGEPLSPSEIARAAALFPVQVIGAPIVATAVCFWRVRGRARALQHEIAMLDLLDFREKMSTFPRATA